MAQSAARQRYQQRRDERALAEGWTGYGQKRAAAAVGYAVPAEYHAAKTGRPRITAPVAPNPFTRRRRIPGGGEVGTVAGRIGIEAKFTRPAMRAVERELRRYRPDRRMDVWIGRNQLFKRNGASVGWVLSQSAAAGGLYEFISAAHVMWAHSATSAIESLATGATTVSFTIT